MHLIVYRGCPVEPVIQNSGQVGHCCDVRSNEDGGKAGVDGDEQMLNFNDYLSDHVIPAVSTEVHSTPEIRFVRHVTIDDQCQFLLL